MQGDCDRPRCRPRLNVMENCSTCRGVGVACRPSAFATLISVLLWLIAAGCGPAPDPAEAPPPAPTQLAMSQPSAPADSTQPSPPAAATPTQALPAQGSAPELAAEREILVSISKQHMWAYDHGQVVVDAVIVTGRPELPTPTGTFRVFAKYSPYRFVSPWPKGSPYYYDPLWSNYAMEFAGGGYFIHDAPWRTDWAHGADQRDGSHGCVNVQTGPMSTFYAWARLGDLVIVEG